MVDQLFRKQLAVVRFHSLALVRSEWLLLNVVYY